ncbi:MarR family winged helix-turn-helix transcriptional regulator [Methylophilus sp.]|jgi:MarR family transcriptional regulator, organic hydroperoxide resistance regulator|uniref:MarR family winged helix-turn-helix transcriptional regulator n=1 Tax=Methylophilus sp. TaxID=29541 RepID=UPI0011D9A0B0|nr:MarR family transcriptional regulator [Methylophilus sp.]TXI43947.1 MAG: MarR family transcriptional regulator [Methylophilus sp.]
MSEDAKTKTPVLQEQLCFSVYSLSLAINKVYRPLLKKLDLTYSQYLVMLVLWESDQRTVSDIGEQLFLDSATLTPLLKRLEAAALVERVRSSQDERQVIVGLTAQGRQLRQHAAGIMDDMLCAMGCSVEELGALRERLNSLRNHLIQHVA